MLQEKCVEQVLVQQVLEQIRQVWIPEESEAKHLTDGGATDAPETATGDTGAGVEAGNTDVTV